LAESFVVYSYVPVIRLVHGVKLRPEVEHIVVLISGIGFARADEVFGVRILHPHIKDVRGNRGVVNLVAEEKLRSKKGRFGVIGINYLRDVNFFRVVVVGVLFVYPPVLGFKSCQNKRSYEDSSFKFCAVENALLFKKRPPNRHVRSNLKEERNRVF